MWLQIISHRRSKFSQPAPRGFACSQNIATVDTRLEKTNCFVFSSLVSPVGIEPTLEG